MIAASELNSDKNFSVCTLQILELKFFRCCYNSCKNAITDLVNIFQELNKPFNSLITLAELTPKDTTVKRKILLRLLDLKTVVWLFQESLDRKNKALVGSGLKHWTKRPLA